MCRPVCTQANRRLSTTQDKTHANSGQSKRPTWSALCADSHSSRNLARMGSPGGERNVVSEMFLRIGSIAGSYLRQVHGRSPESTPNLNSWTVDRHRHQECSFPHQKECAPSTLRSGGKHSSLSARAPCPAPHPPARAEVTPPDPRAISLFRAYSEQIDPQPPPPQRVNLFVFKIHTPQPPENKELGRNDTPLTR